MARSFIADWRNPAEYPSPACAVPEAIAWEFLRRNEAYAVNLAQIHALDEGEFKGGLKPGSTSVLDGLHCQPPANPGETVQQYRARTFNQITKRRGRIFKPWQTFQNRWSLETPVSVDHEYDENHVRFLTHIVRLKHFGADAAKAMNQTLFTNEAAVRFRLDLSIVGQLDAARYLLSRAAEEYDRKVATATGAGTLRSSRDKLAMTDAHLLLRCYDAMRSLSPLPRNNGRNRRRHLVGEAVVLKLINDERALSKSPMLSRNSAVRMCDSASEYIERKKYLLLLNVESGVANAP